MFKFFLLSAALARLTYHTRHVLYNPATPASSSTTFYLSVAPEVLRVALGIELQIHALILATKS